MTVFVYPLHTQNYFSATWNTMWLYLCTWGIIVQWPLTFVEHILVTRFSTQSHNAPLKMWVRACHGACSGSLVPSEESQSSASACKAPGHQGSPPSSPPFPLTSSVPVLLKPGLPPVSQESGPWPGWSLSGSLLFIVRAHTSYAPLPPSIPNPPCPCNILLPL